MAGSMDRKKMNLPTMWTRVRQTARSQVAQFRRTMPVTFANARRVAFIGLTALPLYGFCGITSNEQHLLDHVKAGATDFIRELKAAVLIDSRTENQAGVREVGDYFGRLLAELKFGTRWIAMPPSMGRAGHLWAEQKGHRGNRLLLVGHLDTVLPAVSFRINGNRVTGSGVNDMKGGNLVVIHALRAMRAIGALEDTRIIVCLTGDEEAPGSDLAVAREDLVEGARRSDLALVFEGGDRNLVTTARRGITFWDLVIQGPTGHSAGIFSDAVGSGAVFEAARILRRFHEELRGEDRLTFNPGVIVGGATAQFTESGGIAAGKANIIAQRVLIRGDLRFLDPNQLARIKIQMREIVRQNLARTSAEIRFDDRYPAMTETPGSMALFSQLDQVNRDLGYGPLEPCDPRLRGAGDASFIAPIIPTIDGLGVRGSGAHTPTEDIDLDSVVQVIERAALLIYRLTQKQCELMAI